MPPPTLGVATAGLCAAMANFAPLIFVVGLAVFLVTANHGALHKVSVEGALGNPPRLNLV